MPSSAVQTCARSEEHTSELQSLTNLVCRLLLEKKRRYAWQKAKEQGKGLGTFDFLGFTHYSDETRKGKFKLGRKTSRKKFIQKVKATNVWLKSVRNLIPVKEWWKVLGRKLIGHY